MCTIYLETEHFNVHIHNLYSQPPGSLRTTTYESPIPKLAEALDQPGEHLVLGDFNLHHPMWSGIQDPVQHDMADRLIDIAQQANLQLLTPSGTITWSARGSQSTIDLAFGSESITNRLLTCSVREDLDHGSDHWPVGIEIAITPPTTQHTPRRNWKGMDKDGVSAGAKALQVNTAVLNTVDQIKHFSDYLQFFIQELVENTVPWSTPSSHKGAPWWTKEIHDLVQEERRARRKWQQTRDPQEAERCRSAGMEKRQLIKQSRTKAFREAIHEASGTQDGVWKLAKWARTKGHLPPELPTMPPLRTQTGLAETFTEKVEALRRRFYLGSQADLSDITDTSFDEDTFPEQTLLFPLEVTLPEALQAINKQKSGKAPGPDGVPMEFLKAMGNPMAAAIAKLATSCWRLGYYPDRFLEAKTIVLKKPGKATYSDPGAWRPIALLNTVGKVIEWIMAKRLQDAAEEHRLLPDTQMGARRGRSVDTALELLTEQIHTTWESKKHVATLLSLDISGAFDTVHPIRLLDILRKKGLPAWVVRWIRSFVTNRTTTLSFQGAVSETLRLTAGIPQGSPLSPILFLFYNAELLEICAGPRSETSAVGYVDDVNILAVGTSTEDNCRKIERVHKRCLKWAEKSGMKFAPQKYELVHFTRSRKAFNLEATVNITGAQIEPKGEVRVLGVWLDAKLK